MYSKPGIVFVTAYCTHYWLPVLEMLSDRYGATFIFTRDGKRLGWDNYDRLTYVI